MKTTLVILFIGSVANALSPNVYPQYGGTCESVKSCMREDLNRLISQLASPQPGYEQYPKTNPEWRQYTLEERVRILESYHVDEDFYPCDQKDEFRVRRHCLHASPYPMIHSAALDYCKNAFSGNRSLGRHEMDAGGRLFEPKDPVTADRIYLKAFGNKSASVKSFWLGIHDMSDEGHFTYDSNNEIVPPAFQRWNDGEPNNWGHGGEDCVEVKKFDHWKYLWNDLECSASEVYALCERIEKDGLFEEVEELKGRLDVLEMKSYMYYQPGHVILSKDNLVWINQLWGKEFKVEFEIMVPYPDPFLYNTVYSVFSIYADKGGKNNFIKDLPAVLIKKVYSNDPKISIEYMGNKKVFDITFGKRQHFEISVQKEADGKFYWEIKTGDSSPKDGGYRVEITSTKRYQSALLYLSNPEHSVFEDKLGRFENLKIVNTEQEKEFKKIKKNHTEHLQFPDRFPPPFIIGKK
jgi:hypothetical protein